MYLPIGCLEGQEDLLPLFIGTTPQAVDDGLLVSSCRKKSGHGQDWGHGAALLLETSLARALQFSWASQFQPHVPPLFHHHWGQVASTQQPHKEPLCDCLGSRGQSGFEPPRVLTKAFHSLPQDLGIS